VQAGFVASIPALNRFIAYRDSTPDYRPNRNNAKSARLSQPPPRPGRTDERSNIARTSKKPRTDKRQRDCTDIEEAIAPTPVSAIAPP
jgi:hypothetical protein